MGQLIVTLGLLVSSLSAQVVVDPSGGGHFRDLQQAIDAVPAGSVLRVIGGVWGPLVVPKSLTILADPRAVIRSPVDGSGDQPPAITLRGDGNASLSIANVMVGGGADGASWNSAGPGIAGSGFRELTVMHSTISAHEWRTITGVAYGASGIAIINAARVVLVRSEVRASKAWTDSSSTWGIDGAPGLRAASAVVFVLDSTVRGGGGGEARHAFGQPTPTPCPCPGVPGAGGTGIVADIVTTANATVTGGVGGDVHYSQDGGRTWIPWGRQLDGTAILARRSTQASGPIPLDRARVGLPFELYFAIPTWTAGALALAADLIAQPITIPGFVGELMVDPGAIALVLPYAPGTTAIRLAIPGASALIGARFATQWLLVGPSPQLGRVSFDVIST